MEPAKINRSIREEEPMLNKQTEELLTKLILELVNWIFEKWRNRKKEVNNDDENKDGKQDRES